MTEGARSSSAAVRVAMRVRHSVFMLVGFTSAGRIAA